MRAIKCSMSQFFLGCRAKILACRSDMLKPLVDQPDVYLFTSTSLIPEIKLSCVL